MFAGKGLGLPWHPAWVEGVRGDNGRLGQAFPRAWPALCDGAECAGGPALFRYFRPFLPMRRGHPPIGPAAWARRGARRSGKCV